MGREALLSDHRGFCNLKQHKMVTEVEILEVRAKILEIELRMEAMKAANKQKEMAGMELRWGYKDFMKLVEEITGKPKPKEEYVKSCGSVKNFLDESGYSSFGETEIQKYAVFFYEEYKAYCHRNGLNSLSNVLFSRGLYDLGYLKQRDKNGIAYTVFTK